MRTLEGTAYVLDWIGYKNKIGTLQWEERLWRQHLQGDPPDVRSAQDRQRYIHIITRVDAVRSIAQRLHQRRVKGGLTYPLHAPYRH